MLDTFATHTTMNAGTETYTIASLKKLGVYFDLSRLPYSLKILLENLLRLEDGTNITSQEITALANWNPHAAPSTEISFLPSRILLQDFTGVPCLVDIAAMREAWQKFGRPANDLNPLLPVELVIDHSIQVDTFATPDALAQNTLLEFQRNHERYAFLRWGQKTLHNFKVVPPASGIVHQVNLEYLARVVTTQTAGTTIWALPDTLFGTDSHSTMINALGVLGWGVGGIEAEAAMLGLPSSMLIPQVVGVRLRGSLPEGVTATDLVLTITQILRQHGVVGKFVEFFGDGITHLPLATRATLANMAPEYGATCGFFPVDSLCIDYLRLCGRSSAQLELIEHYCREQGLWHDPNAPTPTFTSVVELDLSTVAPAVAGPRRPQDRLTLAQLPTNLTLPTPDSNGNLAKQTARFVGEGGHDAPTPSTPTPAPTAPQSPHPTTLQDGSVVIAAITSCTNTSNPQVMLAAGLLARNAVARGLTVKPWVKTSLAPGSCVVTDYLTRANLMPALEHLGFGLVGYGCTTCIGNSGPLPTWVSREITANGYAVAAVLSGNRNFEGRIHAEVKLNYLASPPLVVAFALAGSVNIDLTTQPLGCDPSGQPVYLKDLWPTNAEIDALAAKVIDSTMFARNYRDIFAGDATWQAIDTPAGDLYTWQPTSTYIKLPPYFEDMTLTAPPLADIAAARCLALLGDSITTDHISPAGAIKQDSPAGRYLLAHGVKPEHFNSYGARRGNHEVMVRGTFANIRIRNRLLPDVEGGFTRYHPTGEQLPIYDAAMRYQTEGTPLVVIAGQEYGTGSSRDWAAKGTLLLGVKAVLAESFERIHRANLAGMGVLPLEFLPGESATTLELTGNEQFDLCGITDPCATEVTITATSDQRTTTFKARVALLTPGERTIYRHGGILPYTLRKVYGAL